MVKAWPVIRWRQVWINPNADPMAVRVLDPIPHGTAYAGNLSCETQGASTTTRCAYDPSLDAVIWEGTLGPDPGHTTENAALNEVVITFDVRATNAHQDTFVNTSKAYWDQNHNGAVDPTDPNVAARAPIKQRAQVERPALPETGFAPHRFTVLPPMPADLAYHRLGLLWLEIPRLGVRAPIVGVPRHNGQWDITWLWDQIGWLEGSAFPTWPGNTVLTAHNYLSTGTPGPFVDLIRLRWGDRIRLHAYGAVYEYEVRLVRTARPSDLWPLEHKDKDWLTLITCTYYDPRQDAYRYRVVVQAVLVSWHSEP